MSKEDYSAAMNTFSANINDVHRLINIHKDLTGNQRGRRWGVEVLNKSAILLITACWEAYVEDLIKETCEFLLKHSKIPEDFPREVRFSTTGSLLEEKREEDKVKVWQLAGSGWKKVIRDYVEKKIKYFHTPSSSRVDELVKKCVGKENLTSSWHWKRMSPKNAKTRLDKYISLRGEIAHRATPPRTIRKFAVRQYLDFIYGLVVKSNNIMRQYLKSTTGKIPWGPVKLFWIR